MPNSDPVGETFDQRGEVAGTSAELTEPTGEVDVPVRVSRQHVTDPLEVLGPAAHVRPDERRPWALEEKAVEGGHQLGEGRQACSAEPPFRVNLQLVPALVLRRERFEEGHRVGGVDQHGQPQLSGAPQDGNDALVVRLPRAAPEASRTERPRSFHTLTPRAPASTDATSWSTSRSTCAEPVSSEPRMLQSTWQNVTKRPGYRAVVAVDVRDELVAPAAVEVDDRVDTGRVHHREQVGDVGNQPVTVVGQPPPQVVVGIDHRGIVSLRRDLGSV